MKALINNQRLLAIISLTICLTSCAAKLPNNVFSGVEPGIDQAVTYPGFLGYTQLYIPTNYDSSKKWPLIIYYHGFKSRPNTAIMRALTEGKDYIILGINYANRDFYQSLADDKVNSELWHLNRTLEALQESYSVDSNHIFMAGYSQGGYATSRLGELILPQLKGLMLLGAGRNKQDLNPPNIEDLTHKPIFIGAGDKDLVHGARARQAARNYLNWGADVTYEVWHDKDHFAGFRIYIEQQNARYNVQNWLKKHTKLSN
jgi:predicted esterase